MAIGEKAITDAAKAVQGAAALEETRFSNLNTRALSLISASSVVTALLGFFAKDLLTAGKFENRAAAVIIGFAVLALVADVWIAVVGVLLPSRRPLFGDNAITREADELISPERVNEVVFAEYLAIMTELRTKNGQKATALHAAYIAFAIAVVLAAAALVAAMFTVA